jgi:hypothetical protein
MNIAHRAGIKIHGAKIPNPNAQRVLKATVEGIANYCEGLSLVPETLTVLRFRWHWFRFELEGLPMTDPADLRRNMALEDALLFTRRARAALALAERDEPDPGRAALLADVERRLAVALSLLRQVGR